MTEPKKPPRPKKPASWLPHKDPWMPLEWSHPDIKPDIYAIQALARGEATPEQQKRALVLIIEHLCGTYQPSYRTASSRDSDFAEGKRFVGVELAKFLKLNLAAFE